MSITTVATAIEAAKHPVLLQKPHELAGAWRVWETRKVLGIDTEFVRERTYRAELGLVQVSDGETAWLVDPVRLPSLDILAELLGHPDIMKILHSGTEDLEVLLHSVGVIPDPLIDTQVACALLGQPLQMGYHTACKWLFGIEVDKDQTRSNWCKRPLTERQLHYAATDVVLLPLMLEKLQVRLTELGRWDWLLEEAARMQRTARSTLHPDDAYLRFNAAARMKEPSLRVLQTLARWREETAITKNSARGFVIPDAAMLEMARNCPGNMNELKKVSGLHPRAADHLGQQLLKLIAEALSDPTPVTRPDILNERQNRLLKQMRQAVQRRAKALDVEPALLASRKELEKLLHAEANGKAVPERFTGWRQAVITDELLAIIR